MSYDRLSIKLGLVTVPEKKKNPIPKKSKKRQQVEREYKKIVKANVGKPCEIKSPVCTGKMQGMNHKQKRSPANLIKLENLEPACNACNLYCELHPNWAVEHGHQISRFKK